MYREWIVLYLVSANVAAFILYGTDKRRARLGKYRISEAALILTAALGGAAGALAGMLVFHHKTRKWKFKIQVPFFLAVHVLLWFWFLY